MVITLTFFHLSIVPPPNNGHLNSNNNSTAYSKTMHFKHGFRASSVFSVINVYLHYAVFQCIFGIRVRAPEGTAAHLEPGS